tara:strand:+ start:277 stop:582 length:306 start_codon:yes stop_codon:yes gene_type:complete
MMNKENQHQPDFFLNESAYTVKYDFSRLKTARAKVFALMRDSQWRTIEEIAVETAVPHTSASAYLRDFRKEKCGLHVVDRRIRGSRSTGLWEYKLIENKEL